MENKWISVKERFPASSSEQVLCYYTTFKGEYIGMVVLYFWDGEWWRSTDGLWPFNVSHWMPLPPPPTKEG